MNFMRKSHVRQNYLLSVAKYCVPYQTDGRIGLSAA